MSPLQADLFRLYLFRDGNTRATTTPVALVTRHAGWNLARRDVNVAGVQVLRRYAYEASRNESGRRLEPMFESIVSPLERQAVGTAWHSAHAPLGEHTDPWEDEVNELQQQRARLVSASDKSAQRRAADIHIDP